jgi:predicted metalloprotease
MADEEAAPGAPTVPEPGHFLPGGAGETEDPGTAGPRSLNRPQLGLGKARPVNAEVDPALRKAPPSAGSEHVGGYGAPPPAPLPGVPGKPLQGTRQGRGARPIGWHSTSTRAAPQFTSEAPPVKPPRRFSKPVIAGISAFALVVLGGGAVAGFKLIDSIGNPVDNPLARPSVKQSGPLPAPVQPTVTVTAKPVPDEVRVKQNKIYAVGKVLSVNCVEPSIKPNSQSAILRYYQSLLPCLNKAWAPLVKKAGYPFRAPTLTLLSKLTSSTCTGETNRAFYCGDDESINMNWQADLKLYKQNALAGRTWMMDTLVHEYGHHVQYLTNISISSQSREGWAKAQAAKLEENRRLELQATCFGAAFLGANKKSLGFTGAKLTMWEYQIQHSGDEYDPKKVRDHGSRKNQWLWSRPAFNSANPGSCNTYTAPATKVS